MPGQLVPLVLVVVIAVRGVAMPVVGVVDVVTMSDRLMPAAGPVSVPVACMGQVRQRMLVVMVAMRSVGMTFVYVVGVAVPLHAGVPAVRPVLVRVGGVNLMLACHGSSLLCWTASATMWATC